MMNGYIKLGSIYEIPLRGSRRINYDGRSIALFRTENDQVFALNDSCPHKKGNISEGIVHSNKVTCPLHNWVFDLSTGIAEYPDEGKIFCYEVAVKENLVYMRINNAIS